MRTDIPCSDHFPVVGTWRVEGEGPVPQANRHISLTTAQITKCCDRVWKNPEIRPYASIDSITQVIQTEVHSIQRQHPKQSLKHYWIDSPSLRKLRKKMKQAWKRHYRIGSEETWRVWYDYRKEWRATCKSAKERAWRVNLEQMSKSAKGDPRSYFQASKRLIGGKKKLNSAPELFRPSFRGPPQRIEPEEVNAALCTHFREIVEPRLGHGAFFREGLETLRNRHTSNTVLESKWNKVLTRISSADVNLARQSMKLQTAVGPDDVSLKLLSALCENPTFVTALANAFTQVIQRGAIPDEWRSSWWVMIPKVDCPSSVTDFRTIAVTNCVYRVFMKIIQRRMVQVLEEEHCLQGSQFGFRRGRSTIEPIAVMTEVIQRRFAVDKVTYACFLDLRTAYDSVHMEALQTALMLTGCSEKLTAFLVEVYRYSNYQLILPDGSVTAIRGTVGLRQGCCLSPILFSIIMDQFAKKLYKHRTLEIPGVSIRDWERCNDGKGFNHLFFADDGVLVADTAEILQSLVAVVVGLTGQWGLQLNAKKSGVMVFSKTKNHENLTIKFDGVLVPQVESYKYLGCVFTPKMKVKQMAEPRIKSLEAQLKILSPFCKTLVKATEVARSRVVRAICESALLYGAEIWLWGAPMIKKVRSSIGKMGQMVLGVHKKANRTLSLLECGCWDPVAVTIRKRSRLFARVMAGSGSPLKAIMASTGPALLHNIGEQRKQLQVDITLGWQLGTETRRKQMVILSMKVLKQEASEKEMSYLNRLWGVRPESDSLKMVHGCRWLNWMRIGAVMYYHQLDRLGIKVKRMEGCGWCKGTEKDGANHMLLRCGAWKEPRDKWLGTRLEEMRRQGVEEQEQVVRLLGGETRGGVQGESQHSSMISFMQGMSRLRQGILWKLKSKR